MSTLITIVHENDIVAGSKERTEIGPHDIYRVSALWLTNTKGEILMAQRAFTKKNDPGTWGPAVAGTIEANETYEENIVKEIEEEIGLRVSIQDLILGPKIRNSYLDRNYFTQWFMLTKDIPVEELRAEEGAVERLAWFAPEALRRLFAEHPEQLVRSAYKWIPLFVK